MHDQATNVFNSQFLDPNDNYFCKQKKLSSSNKVDIN